MGEKIVLVGGLDATTNKCKNIEKTHEYYDWCTDGKGYLLWDKKLGSSLKKYKDEILTEDIYEFIWSQDPVPHEENYNALDGNGGTLKKKFKDWFYDKVCKTDEECEVSFIAHSWGTIIASDFIASLRDDKVTIKTVITYASPVTGAQIKADKDPFWEIAVDRVKSMQGKWVNVVNKKDVVAWDIPNTINLNQYGYISSKGILMESFPVDDSELDKKYLIINPHILSITGCILGREVASPFSCSILAANLSYVTERTGINVNDILDFGQYFVDTHFTKNYKPDRLVSYLLINNGFAKKYFDNNFGVENLGLPTSDETIVNTTTCQSFEKGLLLWNKKYTWNYIKPPDDGIVFVDGIGLTCDVKTIGNCFDDVYYNTRYGESVCKLKSEGLVRGYDNNKFSPENTINRSEFLKIVLLAKYEYTYILESLDKIYADSKFRPFPDIEKKESDWINIYGDFAKYYNIIDGYDKNSYCKNDKNMIWDESPMCPKDYITFAEASKIIVNTLLADELTNEDKVQIKIDEVNKNPDYWKIYANKLNKYEIYILYSHEIHSHSYGLFSVDKNVNRAEMAYIIAKVKGWI